MNTSSVLLRCVPPWNSVEFYPEQKAWAVFLDGWEQRASILMMLQTAPKHTSSRYLLYEFVCLLHDDTLWHEFPEQQAAEHPQHVSEVTVPHTLPHDQYQQPSDLLRRCSAYQQRHTRTLASSPAPIQNLTSESEKTTFAVI